MENKCSGTVYILPILLLILPFLMPTKVISQNISVEIESGVLWFSKNDVQVPNNSGTRFDMLSLLEADPNPFYRVQINTIINRRHTFRLLLAPLRVNGTGPLFEPVQFGDTTFAPFIPTRGNFKYNTYRFTYQYMFYIKGDWKLGAGLAGLIRDTKIDIVQSNTRESRSHVGFFPLVHFYAERNFGSSFSSIFDIESIAGPRGKSMDAAVTLNYTISPSWRVRGGYRLLAGSTDIDEFYNSTRINYGFLGFRLNI